MLSKIAPNQIHCHKNNLNLCIKTERLSWSWSRCNGTSICQVYLCNTVYTVASAPAMTRTVFEPENQIIFGIVYCVMFSTLACCFKIHGVAKNLRKPPWPLICTAASATAVTGSVFVRILRLFLGQCTTGFCSGCLTGNTVVPSWKIHTRPTLFMPHRYRYI